MPDDPAEITISAEQASTPASSTRDVFGVLRIRAFRRLWINLSLSSLGDWLGLLATTALGAQLAHSYSTRAYAIGGVLIVRLLPALVVGPLAGAFVDRFDRRYTMVVADVVRFALYASIPVVHTLLWLLLASFLTECFSLFWIPAKEASVPNLVPRERLEAANQLSLISSYGSAAVASAAFALLSVLNSVLAAGLPFFRTNSLDLALYFDAATFLFSAYTVFRIPEISRARAARPTGAEQVGMVRSITEGWAFVRSTRWLRGLVVGIVGAVAAGAAVIGLGKLFALDLGGGNTAYGVLFGTIFLGLASGMFVGPRLLAGLSRRRMMGLSIVAAGVSLALDAVMPNLLLAILMTFFVGAFAGVTWVVGYTLVGLEVSDDRRGRTFSFMYTVMRIDMLLVLAAAPFIAGAIGPHRLRLLHVSVRLDGVTLTLFVAGVLGALVGVICYRMMDDRKGVSLVADLISAVRGGTAHPGPRGLLIAFEGGDGAGKSTQVRLLADWLTAAGQPVVTTREPGATALGRGLRTMLLQPPGDGPAPTARTEALLYAADRSQHVSEVIRPALARGDIVVTDRFVDSTLAYQGAGRALPRADVARLVKWASGGLRPDLTVVLDVDPAVGLRRAGAAADRLEAEPAEFHTRVRGRFLELAHRDARYLVLDASAPAPELAAAVRERVQPLLRGRPAAGGGGSPDSDRTDRAAPTRPLPVPERHGRG